MATTDSLCNEPLEHLKRRPKIPMNKIPLGMVEYTWYRFNKISGKNGCHGRIFVLNALFFLEKGKKEKERGKSYE